MLTTRLTLTFVSLYSWGNVVSSKSLIKDGLLWAAELKATKATLLTFKSGSCKVFKNSPMHCLSNGSMVDGWSEIVNFTAVTTVVLISGDGETRERFSFGNKCGGSISVSLPRHSATTFRVPSSLHSQCLNSCCQIAGTNGNSC